MIDADIFAEFHFYDDRIVAGGELQRIDRAHFHADDLDFVIHRKGAGMGKTRGDVEMLSGVEEILASDHHGKVKQNAQGTDAEQPRQEFGREQKIAFPVHDIHNTPAFRV